MGRSEILKSIQQNKPELLPLPKIDVNLFNEEIDVVARFKENVALVGGTIHELADSNAIESTIKELYPNAANIVDCTKLTSLDTIPITKETNPHDLDNVDLAIVKSSFGVAENGAVWVSEEQFISRVLPFITDDLVIILDKSKLCAHLHDAYNILGNRERSFGLFLSGPSKTADIEQCLVIGAQGALSLCVLLV